MKIKYDNDFLYCSGVAPGEKNVMENFFNAVYSKAKNHWRLPANLWATRELAKEYPDLVKDEAFLNYGKQLRQEVDHALAHRRNAMLVSPDERLRPYQMQDIVTLMGLPRAGIFNEPRTGKTPTTITLLKAICTERNLVVAPASLIWNWAKEFAEWYPECEVHVIHGTQSKRKKIYGDYGDFWTWHQKSGPRVLIISKDTLKSDVSYVGFPSKFDTMIVDEAHYLRNWKTKQAEAVCGIEAVRKYALTGTPTVKHAADIFGILRFLHPSKFPSYWQFAERYFGVGDNYAGFKEVGRHVKPHRAQELKEMVGLWSVARKRKEVMPWLPEKQRINIPIEMPAKQKKMYDEMKKFFMTEEGIDAENILTQMMRLRQILLDPRLLDVDVKGAKTEAILEWLDDNREPVVIMSMFTSYLKLLKPEIEKLGLKVGEIHGEMSNAQKQESAVSFQMGRTQVLLCNIISAGTGFTLDVSENVIFTDKAWNPADNDQAEDRVTPTTEEKNHSHNIISFECRATMDEAINRILDTKRSLTDIINEGGRQAVLDLLRG
jgi:SNF2 family DNA or RNA helicase